MGKILSCIAGCVAGFVVVALLPRTANADEVLLTPVVRLHPVTDTVLIVGGLATAGAVALISGTGEIQATKPGNPANLFFLDRPQTETGLGGAEDLTFAADMLWYGTFAAGVLFPIVTGVEHGAENGWVDLALYVESVAITAGVTQIVRITTLRPRPSAYIEARQGTYDHETAGTGTSMSFFSGHVAAVSAVGATMTYLEFMRNPGTVRPWLSMGFWTGASVAMSYLRVASHRHFVTDATVGVLFGAIVGTLVPHLHRQKRSISLTASLDHESGSLGVHGTW